MGNRLRQIRQARGLTLKQLAELSGVSVSTIQSAEIRQSMFSTATMARISAALDLDPAEINPDWERAQAIERERQAEHYKQLEALMQDRLDRRSESFAPVPWRKMTDEERAHLDALTNPQYRRGGGHGKQG